MTDHQPPGATARPPRAVTLPDQSEAEGALPSLAHLAHDESERPNAWGVHPDVRLALLALRALMLGHRRRWSYGGQDAILAGILVGWDCPAWPHPPESLTAHPHGESCPGEVLLTSVALQHQWGPTTLEQITRLRHALAVALGERAPGPDSLTPQAGEGGEARKAFCCGSSLFDGYAVGGILGRSRGQAIPVEHHDGQDGGGQGGGSAGARGRDVEIPELASPEAAARFLAGASESGRYAGEEWRMLIDYPDTVEHAYREARRHGADRGPAHAALLVAAKDLIMTSAGRTPGGDPS